MKLSPKITHSFETVFGLAFDVEKTAETKSGFKPAFSDLKYGMELYGDIRLEGFAALTKLGFTKNLVIVGGNETRYEGETPVVNRAVAICEMLISDYGIEEDKVSFISSDPNTAGNVTAIKKMIELEKLNYQTCAIVSNFYHLPRAIACLNFENMFMAVYPAEAFSFLEDKNYKDRMLERFGNTALSVRMAKEIEGIASRLK